MAKKSKGKSKNKKPKKKPAARAQAPSTDQVSAAGDLRLVPLHMEAMAAGRPEAENALLALGRDAAFTAQQVAESMQDEKLLDFARRLVAVKPMLDTNLYQLREASVRALLEDKRSAAIPASEAMLQANGTFCLFDPLMVAKDLAHGGRPRREAERIEAGHLSPLGLPAGGPFPVQIHLEKPPEGSFLRRRLRVHSGLLFGGALEASDGPRLGTVRLDPFSTSLNNLVGEQQPLIQVPEGLYASYSALQKDDEGAWVLHIYLCNEGNAKESLGLQENDPHLTPVHD